MSVYEKWIKHIPSQFVGKLNIDAVITAFAIQIEEVKKVNEELMSIVDIDTAFGKNLDMIGDIVNVSRKKAYTLLNAEASIEITDDMYRNVLRFQALKNNSNATYADIMRGLHLLWGNAIIKYEEAVREPASIEISIQDITTDETDPALVKPMVIHPGGVKVLFRSIYTDKAEFWIWEKFGNCSLSYEKNHRWNGAYKWGGNIGWHPDGVTFNHYYDGAYMYDGGIQYKADGVEYHDYRGGYLFDGSIHWESFVSKEDVGLGDAVLLNQAKRKMLKSRFDSNISVEIAGFVFGTGIGDGGKPYEPDQNQTELRHEIIRKSIDNKSKISDSCYRYTGILSEIEGNGEFISEIGLIDTDGMVICIKTFDRKIKNLEAEMTFRIDDMLKI